MTGLELAVVIGRTFLIMAAITTTAFPVLYAFAPWYHSLLGRVVMTQALVLALAIDIRVVLTFISTPSFSIILIWINVGIIIAIAITSGVLCYVLVAIRLENRRKRSHAGEQDV